MWTRINEFDVTLSSKTTSMSRKAALPVMAISRPDSCRHSTSAPPLDLDVLVAMYALPRIVSASPPRTDGGRKLGLSPVTQS